jgi:hypothetical protein
MRISHSLHLIYLAVPRTGSTTVRAILDPYADMKSTHISTVTPDFPFYHHISALELKNVFAARGWDWGGYRNFCVIRNPYDRVVSLYHHHMELFADNVQKLPASFRQYVLAINPVDRLPTSLQAFTCDENGDFLVRDVLRFEQLHAELPSYLADFGIHVPADQIPHLNASKSRRSYREYYDTDTKARVEQLYRYEIDRFDYTF